MRYHLMPACCRNIFFLAVTFRQDQSALESTVKKFTICAKHVTCKWHFASWQTMRGSSTRVYNSAHADSCRKKVWIGRAGLKGRGAGAIFTGGPYDVFHDVILCKIYVFADSQLSCLLFPAVDYDARRINSIVSRPWIWAARNGVKN